jgi:hypothetical protein
VLIDPNHVFVELIVALLQPLAILGPLLGRVHRRRLLPGRTCSHQGSVDLDDKRNKTDAQTHKPHKVIMACDRKLHAKAPTLRLEFLNISTKASPNVYASNKRPQRLCTNAASGVLGRLESKQRASHTVLQRRVREVAGPPLRACGSLKQICKDCKERPHALEFKWMVCERAYPPPQSQVMQTSGFEPRTNSWIANNTGCTWILKVSSCTKGNP